MKRMTAEAIVTITLNPALDQTVYIPHFAVGEVNRVSEQRIDPGGKGINVAKVVKALGYQACVTGFLGQDNSKQFAEFFHKQGIDNQFLEIEGAARVNIKIVDDQCGKVTEINFPGMTSSQQYLAELEAIVEHLATRYHWFVLAGSLPQGVPDSVYRRLTEILKKQQAKVFLDTSGAALREAVKAVPYAIKPNLEELGQLVGKPLLDEADVRAAMAELLDSGIEKVVVTLGADGAMALDQEGWVLVQPPRVEANSTVGAGDAMLAGLVVGEMCGHSLAESVRLGTAAATASVLQPGTQAGSRQEVEELLQKVKITSL